MELNIGISDVKESNEFLRCLWSEMANEFGTCGWQYIPVKDGSKNKITFGLMNINQGTALEVGITYKEKGSINNIYFLQNSGEEDIQKGTELYNRLKKVVNVTKESVGKYQSILMQATIKAYFPIMSYIGESFVILPMVDGDSQLSCIIKAYDVNQASGYFARKVSQVMDFLSVETNAVFRRSDSKPDEETITFEKEIYQDDREFMDDLSLVNDYLVISKEGKQLIEQIASIEEMSPELELFLKACSHYHSAKALEEQIYIRPDGKLVSMHGGNKTEIATTLYLSALEVVTLIGFTEDKCESCGQPKFQIGKRVKELTSRYLPSDLVKEFVDYYNKRSRYLHAGQKLVTETPTLSSIPLLDPNGLNGCDFPYKVPLKNLGEWVSYCLRQYYKENLIKCG
ncbi:hypothetical protein [Heyndrickxia coagulans]|uniref:Apea-like HEPN domain-containing protein n=1 Tax=Heyndrickxia coagulans TaxID=1398 RepID=A0A150K9F6_HEYCO|nr:hypothetical protein [Heyndrickxia coagulans]KYC65991.1 hypothetical protein B4098_0861 [Heyndrickxia coagulans]